MYQIIWGTHKDDIGRSVGGWYFSKIEKPNYDILSLYCAMGIVKPDGTLAGAAIFTNYNHANIEVHFYGPNAVTPKTWRSVLRFAFLDLKVLRLTTMTNRGNKKVLRVLPRLGFKYETSLKRFYGLDRTQDAIVHVIYREDIQRFLSNGHPVNAGVERYLNNGRQQTSGPN